MMTVQCIHRNFKTFLISGFLILSSLCYSQNTPLSPDLLKPDPTKEKMFLPYLAVKHGGISHIEQWKKNNTYQYYQELWYYSESFYVKRNHQAGVRLDESIIDISRFESSRKYNEEVIITLPGFSDAIVLLPGDKLIYLPK